jgi:hypothetical protein
MSCAHIEQETLANAIEVSICHSLIQLISHSHGRRVFRQSSDGIGLRPSLANRRSFGNLPYNLHNATEDFLVGFLNIGTAVGFPSTVLVGFCRHRSNRRRCLVGGVP